MLHDGYVNERYCGSHATLYVYLNHHIVQLYTILEKYLSQSFNSYTASPYFNKKS